MLTKQIMDILQYWYNMKVNERGLFVLTEFHECMKTLIKITLKYV